MSSTVRRAISRRALFGLSTPDATPTARISDACLTMSGVMCESCAESCDYGAIRFARRGLIKQPILDADACTGCGECVSVCPASAIEVREPEAERST